MNGWDNYFIYMVAIQDKYGYTILRVSFIPTRKIPSHFIIDQMSPKQYYITLISKFHGVNIDMFNDLGDRI